ncbi:MAG: cation diffusion facilitator family transporter, partial [Deltaproteobacteria bacterium]|nr:cation diffusion facilitator family transporter [Deltaproteobacteria bacterium]
MGFLATVWRDDRQRIALVSVGLAAFLSAMKLLWGVLTGSLGIISEGLHSSLDLTAAIITFFAVKEARKPPDPEHRYGHGKIESFSALIESGLLFLTCAWIIYEAVSRLFFKDVHVEVSVHSFLVMGISIVVDVTRARTLRRAARRFRSLAFEADA